MADFKKCDRCGIFFKNGRSDSSKIIIKKEARSSTIQNSRDLCHECTDELYEWLDTQKEARDD